MSTIPNLNVNTFRFVKTLKSLAAYLIEQGGKKAVLKGEDLANVGTKRGGDDYKGRRARFVASNQGTPQVKKSIIIAAELIAYVTGEGGIAKVQTFTSGQTATIARRLPEAATDIQAQKEAKEMVWFTMPCFDSLIDLLDPMKVPRSLVMDLQKHPDSFDSLGRILACDMFLGNSDRFGQLKLKWKKSGFTCRKKRAERNPVKPDNPGNVFLTWYPLRFLGIDFLDTQCSPAPYMGVPWPQFIETVRLGIRGEDVLWNFNLLKKGSTKLRDEAARFVIEALGNHFEPNVVFNSKARKALREGLRTGRNRLKEFYDKQIGHDHWPRGLASRFVACGW